MSRIIVDLLLVAVGILIGLEIPVIVEAWRESKIEK